MATEEQLRDAQILKTNAETELTRELLREHKRSSHMMRRIGQGVGVGLVVALAGMVLFGPIKDTIEAESKLAAVNAEIAARTNADLRQRLEERQKQLDVQEQRYTDNLTQLAEDLKKANEARDAAITRSKELAEREKDLAEKLGRLASQLQDNAELAAQAEAAKERARLLEAEITALRAEARAAEATAASVQTRVTVRPLSDYRILVGGSEERATLVRMRLQELGLTSSPAFCDSEKKSVFYYREESEEAAKLLVNVIDDILPDPNVEFRFVEEYENTLFICPDL